MKKHFPEPIEILPKADIPIKGITAYISQAENHQIIFMEFHKEVHIPKHCHEAQWEIVLNGKVDVWIHEQQHTYQKGDQFFIPAGVEHYALVSKGYVSIAFFNEPQRYKRKQ